MKKIAFALTLLGLSSIALTTKAQDDDKAKEEKKKKESQEIIIRKKGDKDTKITVEINGDKVTINGKPLSEFKDDNVTINRRNIMVWNSKDNKAFEINPGEFMNGMTWSSDNDEPHAFLGVTTDESDEGAKIVEVTKESAAEKAGLKKGDIITKVGDKKIDGPDELTDVIGDMKPKDQAKVYYKRDGKESSTTATLGERKGGAMAYSFSSPKISRSYSYSMPKINVNPRIAEGFNNDVQVFGDNYGGGYTFLSRHQKLGLKIQDTEEGNGVKVLDVDEDSPAAKAGLKKDDIVTEVGGKKVTNTDEAREELQENADKSSYTIKAKRNGSEMSFDIKIPKKLKTTNL